MVRFLLHGPHWFFGIDAVLEFFAGVIALLIVLASWRYARLAKDKKYGALGNGFLFIFLAFISQIITTGFVFSEFRIGDAGTAMEISNALYVGHVAHVLLFISGLIVLAVWALKIEGGMQRALIMALTMFLAIIGITNPLIFNLTGLILLVFICAKFYNNAIEHDTSLAWEVLTGFTLLACTRIAFMLEPINPQWYVGGHVAQLLGYLVLLAVLIQVLRK